jgi:heme O synthase-like polyprenyltransferase
MKKIFILISMILLITATSTFGIVASTKFKTSERTQLVIKNEDIAQSKMPSITLEEKVQNKIIQIFKRERKFELSKEVIPIDGMAIAGFILGFLSMFIFGFGLGILGAVFSGMALKRIKRYEGKLEGRGLALAGLIFSIIGFLGWSVFLLYYFEILIF